MEILHLYLKGNDFKIWLPPCQQKEYGWKKTLEDRAGMVPLPKREKGAVLTSSLIPYRSKKRAYKYLRLFDFGWG